MKKQAYKPYVPKPHPREADITKAQPPMNKGIQGVGMETVRRRREKS